MINNDVIEQVRDRADIIDVIGRRVQLKRAGSNYKGLCPFHGEKTPSFVVSPQKQIFTCFGCGATGNVIKFVQMIDNLEFVDAVVKLGEEVGITVEQGDEQNRAMKDSMYEASRLAARHFYKNLRHGDNPGLRYVVSRGISPETAKRFGIGFARNEWQDIGNFLRENGISEDLAVQAGLMVTGKKDRSYDKFRNRVIFPIINTRDKVIGFGGRTIEKEGMPKYLNSPESLIFKKKENLYGLNLAKNAIRRQNLAIIVEGYMDVVSLSDAGIENVVASLGTALTPEQAKLLKRYTDNVVLSYDSDNAGQNATMRGIDLLQDAGCNVKVLVVDDGKDPDEYVKKNGKLAFEELIRNAVPFMEWKIDLLKKRFDTSTTEGSIKFLEGISIEIRKIRKAVERDAYIKRVSELTKIPESSIRSEVDGLKPEPVRLVRGEEENAGSVPEELKNDPQKVEAARTMIKLMLGDGQYIPVIAGQPELADFFKGSGYEDVFAAVLAEYKDDEEVDPDRVEDRLSNDAGDLLRDIRYNMMLTDDPGSVLLECARFIRLCNLEQKQHRIIQQMSILNEDEDSEQKAHMNRLTEELMEVNNMIIAIKERR